jgi:hypothetical protein
MQASDRRELSISTAPSDNDIVLLSVADSGPDETAARPFQPCGSNRMRNVGSRPPNIYLLRFRR